MNLTDDQFTAWMAELRANTLPQTTHTLYGYEKKASFSALQKGYCCMGIAGKVCLGLSNDRMFNKSFVSSVSDSTGERFLKGVFTDYEETILSHVNDHEHLTFPQIAAFIEGGGIELCGPAIMADREQD